MVVSGVRLGDTRINIPGAKARGVLAFSAPRCGLIGISILDEPADKCVNVRRRETRPYKVSRVNKVASTQVAIKASRLDVPHIASGPE